MIAFGVHLEKFRGVAESRNGAVAFDVWGPRSAVKGLLSQSRVLT